ncbi:hypothetical protein JCM10296v2_007334 [Rhodotorula toruloides]
MLLRIRNCPITASHECYGEVLRFLLHCPAYPDGHFRTSALVQQALYLRHNVSSLAARYIRQQIRELGLAVGKAVPEDDLQESLFGRAPAGRRPLEAYRDSIG